MQINLTQDNDDETREVGPDDDVSVEINEEPMPESDKISNEDREIRNRWVFFDTDPESD